MPISATTAGFVNNIGPKAVGLTHPAYATFSPIWQQLAHVREGVGGLLDGTYLVAHPREWEDYTATTPTKPTKKLKARRQIACYENFAAAIIEAKKSALFREKPIRRVGDADPKATTPPTPLEDWWTNVDGYGCGIDAFMAKAWDTAATFGHAILYMDRSTDPAEEQRPYVSIYTPLDVLDWRRDEEGDLVAIKLVEAIEEPDISKAQVIGQYNVRIVTETTWTVYNRRGGAQDSAEHGFGIVPIVVLFAQRRPLVPYIGQSVLNDPALYLDLYNLTSELRELLRNQTFGVLNLPLGTGDSAMTVEQAVAMVKASGAGTENVLFSGLAANYLSPSPNNVTVYQAEIDRRLRDIYRLAGIQWESDSKNREAAGSLVLKREDMNTRLAGYADECETAEYALADLFYRSVNGQPDQVEQNDVTIQYPDNFDVTPFDVVLQQAQSALALGMPGPFMKELRKSLVSKFLPGITTGQSDTIEQAIDAAPDEPTLAERLAAKTAAFGKPMGQPGQGGTGGVAAA